MAIGQVGLQASTAKDERVIEGTDRGFSWAQSKVVKVGDRLRFSLALLASLLTGPRSPGSALVEVGAIGEGEDGTKDVILTPTPDSHAANQEAQGRGIPFVVVLGPHGFSPMNQIYVNGKDITSAVRHIAINAGVSGMTTIALDLVPESVVVLGAVDYRALRTNQEQP